MKYMSNKMAGACCTRSRTRRYRTWRRSLRDVHGERPDTRAHGLDFRADVRLRQAAAVREGGGRGREGELQAAYDRRTGILDDLRETQESGGRPSATKAQRLYREMIKEGTVDPKQTSWSSFRHMYNRYALRMEDSREIDMVVFSSTNREKAALLWEYKNTMPPEQYNRVLNSCAGSAWCG